MEDCTWVNWGVTLGFVYDGLRKILLLGNFLDDVFLLMLDFELF